MPNWVTEELQKNSGNWDKVVGDIVKIEQNNFPEHESLTRSFDEELRKRTTGLIYSQVDGDVAGYVMYSWPSSLDASITELAVKDNHKRQGLGEALSKAAIQKCRTLNIQRMLLHVDPERQAAMNLYKKLGFKEDTLVEGYYSPDRSAYRMYLDLDKN